MTEDLVAFLRARLDEDAELANSGESWSAFDESPSSATRRVDVDHSIERVVACTRSWRGLHIARHDPARVLAEVAAKRRVIADYKDAVRTLNAAGPGTPPHDIMTGATNTYLRTLRLLAAVYADHPDYLPKWGPDQ
jgi:hypothetical protein